MKPFLLCAGELRNGPDCLSHGSDIVPFSRKGKEKLKFSEIKGFVSRNLCLGSSLVVQWFKNPPASARDTGLSPGRGRSHMPRSN